MPRLSILVMAVVCGKACAKAVRKKSLRLA